MALRAGAFSSSIWHGVVRNDGFAWYSCIHDHPNRTEATKCARDNIGALRSRDHQNPEAPLPKGWRIHPRRST